MIGDSMKKGFTLAELIVSFVLITVLSIALFKTVISMQEKQLENIEINQFKALTYILNNDINYDFLNDSIETVRACGTNCYDINFKNRGFVKVSVDRTNNTITYGSTKERLPNEYTFVDNIKISQYKDNTNGLNSFVLLSIPIKSKLEPNFSSLKYMHEYDSKDKTISFEGV